MFPQNWAELHNSILEPGKLSKLSTQPTPFIHLEFSTQGNNRTITGFPTVKHSILHPRAELLSVNIPKDFQYLYVCILLRLHFCNYPLFTFLFIDSFYTYL